MTWKTWQFIAAAVVGVILGFALGVVASGDKETHRTDASPSTTQGQTVETVPRTAPSTFPSTGLAAPVDVVTFSGSSTKSTDNFEVRSPWKIRWSIEGGAGVGIDVCSETGGCIEHISTDPGQDETVIRQAGTFYLKLEPFGSSYTVTVNGVPA